jgi:hypothetical protein
MDREEKATQKFESANEEIEKEEKSKVQTTKQNAINDEKNKMR